jgi:large subunit ribosomal protein L18
MSRAKVLKRKNSLRLKRKIRVRSKISGTELLPRLTVFKSNKYFYAQAIDDVNGKTLAAVDGSKLGLKATIADTQKLAVEMASKLKEAKIETVVYDRNGYLYHGVVKVFADGLRDNGIKV